MVEPAWNPQRALRRQQPTAVLHRDDDHPGQREENPPVARPRRRKRSLGGNVRSAATTLKHFSRPLRSERLAKAYADGARRVYPHRRGRVEHRAVVGNDFVNIGNILHEQSDVAIAGTQAVIEIVSSVWLERDGEETAFDARTPHPI